MCFCALGMSSRPSYRVLVGEKLTTMITTTKQPAMIHGMKKLAGRKRCDSWFSREADTDVTSVDTEGGEGGEGDGEGGEGGGEEEPGEPGEGGAHAAGRKGWRPDFPHRGSNPGLAD